MFSLLFYELFISSLYINKYNMDENLIIIYLRHKKFYKKLKHKIS
jgi:hypothetical protein